jgi:hypothetical protein
MTALAVVQYSAKYLQESGFEPSEHHNMHREELRLKLLENL